MFRCVLDQSDRIRINILWTTDFVCVEPQLQVSLGSVAIFKISDYILIIKNFKYSINNFFTILYYQLNQLINYYLFFSLSR